MQSSAQLQYQEYEEEYHCLGTQAFAVDRIINPSRREWPFYATCTALSSHLFPRDMRPFLSVCPQGQFSAAYQDNPTPEGNKRKRKKKAKKPAKDEEKHVAPDFFIYFNALMPYPKDRSGMDHLKLMRDGAATLNHNISTVMGILEVKRDCDPEELKGDLPSWYGNCTANIDRAQDRGYEQAQLCFATHPNAKSVVAIASGGNAWRWTVFYRNLTKPALLYHDGCYVPSPQTDQEIAMRKVPTETLRILNERIVKMSSGTTGTLEVHTPGNSMPNSPSASPPSKRMKWGSPIHLRVSTKPRKSAPQESPPQESPSEEIIPPGKYIDPKWSKTTWWGTGDHKTLNQVALEGELEAQFPEQFRFAEETTAEWKEMVRLEELKRIRLDLEQRPESVPASEAEEDAGDTGSDPESDA